MLVGGILVGIVSLFKSEKVARPLNDGGHTDTVTVQRLSAPMRPLGSHADRCDSHDTAK